MHDVLRGAFQRVKERIAYKVSTAGPDSMAVDSSGFLRSIDLEVQTEFARAQQIVGGLFIRLKMFAYTLALTGEAEAISQARDRTGKYSATKDAAIEAAITNAFGENIGERIQLAFDRLRRRILDAVQLSRIQRLNAADTLEKVDRALPSGTWVKRPRRVLKPVREADVTAIKKTIAAVRTPVGPVDVAQGFVDDEVWENTVDFYLREFVPTYQFRGPDPEADYQYSGWELERDLTHEFVDSVRSGQNEAARQNGIVDFQWIAIVDDKTDTCCLWRDGLTTKEIERELRGKHSDDECDTSVPPAHYNCRCTIAPMLDTMPEIPESNAKEFEEWLNT